MSLTREQALAAAWLVLAGGGGGGAGGGLGAAAAAPPGGTISQGAAAAAAKGAAGQHTGSGAPKKVASGAGAAKYHEPIGALIVPHGKPSAGEHFVHGDPSHMIHSTSEPEWLANQWKDKGKAKEAAEKAVAGGTHHWVQAGEHTYAVHNGLETHVPKDTDIHDEAAVKNAHKVIVKHGEHPEHVMLKPEGPGEAQPHDAGSEHLLAAGYKKLPAQPAKKAVTFGGKHAAWVPHDWQVYHAPSVPEGKLGGKFAKDAAGKWHTISAAGDIDQGPPGLPESWAKAGSIVPDEDHPGPSPAHVAPNQGAGGPEKPKADVGGVAVTKEQIHDALAKLQGSESTQIKGLLKGHPLAASDYHSVYKAELEKHPELKVPAGTKKQHVSQAKNAFIHHLAGKLDELTASEAEAAAAEAAQDKAAAAAVHAQQLTPGTFDIGGVAATTEDIQAAIGKLQGSTSTQIKGLLKGNPLAGSDYWAVVNEYKAAHPAELQHGTKQAHVGNAKAMFIAALEEKASQAASGDLQSGHDTAAELDQVASGGHVKTGWHESADGAVAMALVSAASHGSLRYASLSPEPGVWWIGTTKPEGKAYMEVTPEHQVTMHLAGGDQHDYAPEHVLDIAKAWITDKAPEPELPPEPEPKPVWDTAAWKQTPEYQTVHALIVNHPPGLPPHDNKQDTEQQLAAAMYLAGKTVTKYLVPGAGGGWDVTGHIYADSGVVGTFGMPGKAYYEISPDHEIIAYGPDGQGAALPGFLVAEMAKKWLTPPEPEPEPEKPAAPEPEKPAEPAPEIDQQLKTLLINGAVKPSAEFEDTKQNQDWVLASVLQKVAKVGTERWALKKTYGGWTTYSYDPGAGQDAEWFHVTADLAVTHHAGGKDVTVEPAMVSEIAHQMVVPDSVKLNVTGKHSYATEYKMFKHGFYYKSSKQAKAYLEIKPPSTPAGGTTFIYHAPSGDKQVNGSYAAKVLQDATEYHAQAKDSGVAAPKISYATTAKPGTYQLWSDVEHAPASSYPVEVYADGSLLLGATPVPAVNDKGESVVDSLVKGGSILDQYGTSVVKPGVPVEQYHVFGSEAKTLAELQSLLDQLQAVYGDSGALKALVNQTWPGLEQKKLAISFFSTKVPAVDWEGQRDGIVGLLHELLSVPAQPPGTQTASAEAVFLKGLPPGIHDAKDVFAWTGNGYAKPFAGSLPDYGGLYLTSPELSAKIKEVSAQFGDGKVVGTHISSLAKDAKADWLKAWAAGDMAKVFAYDAAGGKVSPAHPGAPDNAATHHITWAPWDESQVPAGLPVEGAWSPEGVMPPKAEVDNYLIKAGLQHAVFLTAAERRQWMQAHRGHDQAAVDKLSKQAADAFSSGKQPVTEPPVWTENLGPAKSYDAFLDEKTPAQQWPAAALEEFLAGHTDELAPFAQQVASNYGYGSSYSAEELLKSPATYAGGQIQKPAVQLYLDSLAAEEAAEKLKPRYSLAGPGIAADQFGRQYQWITGTPAQLARRSAVAGLALAWGFRTPQVSLVSLEDGTPGAVAPLLAHDGTLAFLPAGIAGLTDRELGDVAREHVLDYALANPGSTPGSYLRVSDGSITGTGKSSALSDLAWAGADQTEMNAQATQPVSLVIAAIADGSLSQDQADAAYIAAVRAARRMAALSDARMQSALAAAGLDEHSAGHLIARKNALPEQIQALWDGVYASAGMTPPEVPSAKLSRGLHSGFTEPEFLDHVAAAKSFGVPAFFNEPGLADGHVLVWTELDPGGQRLIRGEASVRSLAADKVTGWVNAHSGDAASMVPQGEVGFNLAIQHAALYIDKHNMVMKNYDYTGPETAKAMADMAAAKSQLTSQLASAQHALVAGPASADYAAVAKAYGDPASVVSMAQYYLAQIDTAEQAKAAGVGTPLSPGQFPGWKAAEQSVIGGGVKITYKKAARQLGTDAADVTADTWSLGKQDGELHLAAGKSASYPGYVWQVELPTGEVIEINDAGATQTPKAHHGMIRFTSVTADGTASLERIRGFLQHAGLGMEEATQPDMENQYWRTMAWVLSDRADRKEPGHMKVWDELAQGLYGKNAFDAIGSGKEATHLGDLPAKVIQAQLAPEEEAALWRKAWAHLTSPEQVQQWADSEGYLPHLGHWDIHAPEVPGGKPDWYRFDVTPDQAAAQQMLTESLYAPEKDALLVARSGGLLSSDARLRALGTYKTGMSWGSDMSHGASGMVFTRQNQQSESGMSVWISPRVLARAQTYAFPSDHYGEIDDRRTDAFFDFAKASAMSESGNEALILDGISLLDDIEVIKAYSETQRQQIVTDLKEAGITEIRGLPVEDRIVTASGVAAAVKKAAAAMAAAGWFAQPETPFVPPPSALSGAPAAEKKFAQQVVEEEKGMDAQQEAAQVAQKLEELAQGAEVPFSHAI